MYHTWSEIIEGNLLRANPLVSVEVTVVGHHHTTTPPGLQAMTTHHLSSGLIPIQ